MCVTIVVQHVQSRGHVLCHQGLLALTHPVWIGVVLVCVKVGGTEQSVPLLVERCEVVGERIVYGLIDCCALWSW